VNLYLKFNDFGCDPLGEDPYTASIREASVAAVSRPDAPVGEMVPVLARRFDTVHRTYVRGGWGEVLQARVFGEEPFGITEEQFAALRMADGRRTVDDIVREVAAPAERDRVRGDVARLVTAGALDISAAAELARAA
jgi:hypothetical protein